MNFYQELQLDQAGSKAYIASLKTPKEKIIHTGIYLFKILLNIAFCVIFIGLFSVIFGSENSIAGLVVLLFLMMFRFSNLDVHVSHGVAGIFLLFAILAVGPKLSSMLPAGAAFVVDLICILLILTIGCHNVKLFNHASMVLSYLLLLGYEVSGHAYHLRLACFAVGAVLVSAVFYRNQRKNTYQYGLRDLFLGFDLSSERTRWQLRLTFSVSLVMLIANLLGLPKAAWAGIAAMSVCVPARKDVMKRVKLRAPGNMLGGVLFLVICCILPENTWGYIGYIGGICLGFSATYGWQTVSNSISTIALASTIFGPVHAILLRIFHNLLGSLGACLFDRILEPILLWAHQRTCPKEYDF